VWSAPPTPTDIAIQPIPVVTFAYGTLNFHHSIDERIPAGAVVKTAKVYAAALVDYLGTMPSTSP
jgi:acetylornithine deacetylase/succinyl-diaminopimelate desuccinylase-like protein